MTFPANAIPIRNYLHGDQPPVPMTEEQSKMFTLLTWREYIGDLLTDDQIHSMGFGAQVLASRLKHHGVHATNEVIAFFAFLSRSPGDCVMWAHSIAQMASELGRKVVFRDVAQYFPMGFPTEEDKINIWDAQKSKGHGNLVDTDEAWKLFQPVTSKHEPFVSRSVAG
jgi:hypothetical protein